MTDGLATGWFHTAQFLCGIPMLLGFRLRIEGQRHIPCRGPALLIANHQSLLDPIIIGLASPRRLCYLARKTLFRNPVVGAVLHSVGGVELDMEGVGKEGIKTILHELQRGQAVVVYPEGTRTEDGRIQPFRPGIQLLIKRTEAPIVPIGIAGAVEAWPYWRPMPYPAPLFPPAGGGVAAVVGPALEAKRIASLPRAKMLTELFEVISGLKERAERLRRGVQPASRRGIASLLKSTPASLPHAAGE
jgi:1-acyl-sn-glycerol-3-phosphate acyltransferase